MRRNRNKEIELRERVPKRSYSTEQSDDDVLILSDELDMNVGSEFAALKVENEGVLVREEEEGRRI